MYKSGDVVLAQVPFTRGNGYKTRPAIVVERDGNYYLICCCTSTDKSDYLPGAWIEKRDAVNRSLKFRKSTFISFDSIVSLYSDGILFKIGSCPTELLQKIKNHIDHR